MLPLNESWHVADATAYIPQWPIAMMISCKKKNEILQSARCIQSIWKGLNGKNENFIQIKFIAGDMSQYFNDI